MAQPRHLLEPGDQTGDRVIADWRAHELSMAHQAAESAKHNIPETQGPHQDCYLEGQVPPPGFEKRK